AFGTSVSGFAATYRQQQRVDAELTLGADVKVSPDATTPQTAAFADSLRTVPGVVAVSPFDQTVAYVGSELQDLFGVNVFSLRQAATLSDSFFLSGTADTVLSQLAATPNGIIVSEETAKDYSIVAGDHLNIRLTKPDGTFVSAQFQLVGVAREFPTAPKDSFLVVNQNFLHQQIGSDTISTFLVRTNGDPAQVSAAIQNQVGISTMLKVETINTVVAQLASTLTTVSLDELTNIEWVYTLLIAGLALAIFLLGLLAEREAEYATLAAIGATPRQVQAFMLSEAFLASVTGIVFGTVIGLALGEVLVTILSAIFDPPPTIILIPVSAIGALIGLSALSLIASSLLVSQRLRGLQPAYILRNS
ncbi:MAG: FtsX-like permease family protein, partial [Chloroflexota bacterium]